MVLMESVVSGHQLSMIRERLAEKIELTRFDPYSKCWSACVCILAKSIHCSVQFVFAVQRMSLYRERRRVRSL